LILGTFLATEGGLIVLLLSAIFHERQTAKTTSHGGGTISPTINTYEVILDASPDC
jgi:hypothetical protein